MKRKKVVLLGSTGSIGCSTLEVARRLPERIELVGLAANASVEKLAAQVRETGVREVAISDPAREAELRALLPDGVQVRVGREGLCELACMAEADIVLVAIVVFFFATFLGGCSGSTSGGIKTFRIQLCAFGFENVIAIALGFFMRVNAADSQIV